MPSYAQTQATGAWDRINETKKRSQETISKNVSSLRRWKQALVEWGMDTTYQREAGILGRLHSDGWALGLYSHKKSSNGRDLVGFSLSFAEIIHDKQIRQQGANNLFPELGTGGPYIFGKRNNAYVLGGLFTKEKVLLPGILHGSVTVGWKWGLGPALALLKPYYLELVHVDNTGSQPTAIVGVERYQESNRDLFLNTTYILRAGKWSQGLSEITYIPGLQGEFGVTLAPQKGRVLIPKLTLGAAGNIFTNELTIMVDQPAQRWQLRFFASLQLGKRW